MTSGSLAKYFLVASTGTDDFAGTLSNQTNLALKAIVGIGAMSQLSRATGHLVDFIHYDATARAYVTYWYDMALTAKDVTRPHAKLSYQDENSHGLICAFNPCTASGRRAEHALTVFRIQIIYLETER